MGQAVKKMQITSDFASLKNDASVQSIALSIPGSVVLAASAAVTYISDLAIGNLGSVTIYSIKISTNDTVYSIPNGTFSYATNGTVLGDPNALYSIEVLIYRLNSASIRMQATIRNPYSDPLTTESTARTITGYARTFLAPF